LPSVGAAFYQGVAQWGDGEADAARRRKESGSRWMLSNGVNSNSWWLSFVNFLSGADCSIELIQRLSKGA
jgi:heme oxygenase